MTSAFIQLFIAITTVMKKFFPSDYLDLSEKWTLKKSLMDLLIFIIMYVLLIGLCVMKSTDMKSFHKMMAAVVGLVSLIIFCLTLMIQSRIVLAENKKKIQIKISKLFKSNSVSPDPEAAWEDNEEDNQEDNHSEIQVNK